MTNQNTAASNPAARDSAFPPSSGRHDPEAHPMSAAPDPTGRRKFLRTIVELKVQLNAGKKEWTAKTENLSPGGAFIASEELLEVGEAVDLQIEMPNGRHVIAHGCVRWLRQAEAKAPGMGVEFLRFEVPHSER